jgi:hypothetical protein
MACVSVAAGDYLVYQGVGPSWQRLQHRAHHHGFEPSEVSATRNAIGRWKPRVFSAP